MSRSELQFQTPNPLDLMFFAFDRAAERLGLPGAFIHAHLELGGRVDVTGLKRALAALHRVYPVTGSRLEWSSIVGRPRWRLVADAPNLDRAVQVHRVSPAGDEGRRRQIERLLSSRVDAVHLPPLQFHVLTGRDRGDLVIVRWPHALMDARGGFVVIEEIERLYQERPDLGSLTSAGDERRDDFARLTAWRRPGKGGQSPFLRSLPAFGSWRRFRPAACPGEMGTVAAGEMGTVPRLLKPRRRDAQLPIAPPLSMLGPLRFAVRRLSEEQVARARDIARRLCPSVRFGAFLRAAAVSALHRFMPQPPHPGTCYSVPYLIEGRERPYRTPVCRNLFSLDRVRVPPALAPDRRAVANLLHEQTAKIIAAGPMTPYLATVLKLSKLPTAVLAALVRRSLVAAPFTWQRGELAEPPSLPMSFLRAFTRDMPTFCGAELRRTYFFRLPLPRVGMGIQVTAEHGRLTICGMGFEAREEMMQQFLDAFVDALLDHE